MGRIIRLRGGIYRRENSYIEIFTNATFESFSLVRAGFAVGISLDKPPSGRGMSPKDFWEGKKGLSRGILVGLVFRGRVCLGVIEGGELSRLLAFSYLSTSIPPYPASLADNIILRYRDQMLEIEDKKAMWTSSSSIQA